MPNYFLHETMWKKHCCISTATKVMSQCYIIRTVPILLVSKFCSYSMDTIALRNPTRNLRKLLSKRVCPPGTPVLQIQFVMIQIIAVGKLSHFVRSDVIICLMSYGVLRNVLTFLQFILCLFHLYPVHWSFNLCLILCYIGHGPSGC